KDNFELSLVAADLKREDDRERGIIEVPISGMDEPLRLLRCLAIYGPNASGKSTLLTAGHALHYLATESSVASRPGARIGPYEPFILDDSARDAPIELGCDVVLKNSILRYEIAYDSHAIRRERLAVLDGDKEDVLIDRDHVVKVGGSLINRSEANRLYVKEMQ